MRHSDVTQSSAEVDVGLRIRVAVFGDPARGYFAGAERFGEPPYRQPEHRPTVDLVVDEETLLVDALRETGRRLGVSPPDSDQTSVYEEAGGLPAAVSFVTDLLPWGLTWPEATVPLVDGQGRAFWGTHFHEIRYHQLMRAAGAGVLPGDPQQPVLVLESPGGDYAIDWPELLEGLKAVWRALETLDTVGGAIGTAAAAGVALRKTTRRVAGRVRRYLATLQAHQTEWQDRRAWPDAFHDLIRRRGAWRASKLAAALGITQEEADELLADTGFLYDPAADVWLPTAAVVAIRAADPATARGTQPVDRPEDWLTAAAIDLAEYVAYDQAHEADPGAAMGAAAAQAALAVWGHYQQTGQVKTLAELQMSHEADGEDTAPSRLWVPPP